MKRYLITSAVIASLSNLGSSNLPPRSLAETVVEELSKSKIKRTRRKCGYSLQPHLLSKSQLQSYPGGLYQVDCDFWIINDAAISYHNGFSNDEVQIPTAIYMRAKGDHTIKPLTVLRDFNLDGLDPIKHYLTSNKKSFRIDAYEIDPFPYSKRINELNKQERKDINLLYKKHLKRILDSVRKKKKQKTK